MATPPASTAPSSFVGGVTLEAIMAQLVWVDVRLDTLSEELCQVNTYVGCIAWRQAIIGSFTVASSPSPLASEDESDDGSYSDDANEEDGASLPSDDEMSTRCTYHLSLVIKKGSSFDMRVVIHIGGGLA